MGGKTVVVSRVSVVVLARPKNQESEILKWFKYAEFAR